MQDLYRAEYCQVAIDFLSKGRSITALSAHLDVVRSTLYLWRDTHQEFADAIEMGQAKGQAWLEEQGMESLWKVKDFNNGVYMFTMKSQYRVSDGSDARDMKLTVLQQNESKVPTLLDAVNKEHPV